MSRSKALQYYIASRLLFAPLQLLTILTIVFLLLRATPGDPADAILGGRAPESAKEELRKQLGLDLPIWLQYINYLGNILRFDLGTSLTSRGQNVWQIISQHFPATVELAVCSMLVALIVGILVGTLSASRPGTPLDLGGRLFGIITYALPMFWAGMLLQLVFSVQLQWFPNSNRFPPNISPPTTITGLYTIDSLLGGNLNYFFLALYHLALPSLTLGIFIKWHF